MAQLLQRNGLFAAGGYLGAGLVNQLAIQSIFDLLQQVEIAHGNQGGKLYAVSRQDDLLAVSYLVQSRF